MLSSGDDACLQMSRMALHLTWHLSEGTLQYSLEQREAVRTPGNRMVYHYTKKIRKEPKSVYGMCPG